VAIPTDPAFVGEAVARTSVADGDGGRVGDTDGETFTLGDTDGLTCANSPTPTPPGVAAGTCATAGAASVLATSPPLTIANNTHAALPRPMAA
jgi:hypothetical protein